MLGAQRNRISHSGSKAQHKGNTRNHALWYSYVYAVCRGPKEEGKEAQEKMNLALRRLTAGVSGFEVGNGGLP